MEVIIFADPQNPQPSRLNVMYPGLDTLEQSALKYLVPFSTPYRIVDSSIITNSPFIYSTQTVDLSTPSPTFGWNMVEAKKIAFNYNSTYWQTQLKEGLEDLPEAEDFQVQLAIATPVNSRSENQIAIVEFIGRVASATGSLLLELPMRVSN